MQKGSRSTPGFNNMLFDQILISFCSIFRWAKRCIPLRCILLHRHHFKTPPTQRPQVREQNKKKKIHLLYHESEKNFSFFLFRDEIDILFVSQSVSYWQAFPMIGLGSDKKIYNYLLQDILPLFPGFRLDLDTLDILGILDTLDTLDILEILDIVGILDSVFLLIR